MALPKAIRRLTPDRVRHDVRLRALFVGDHSHAELLLKKLLSDFSCAALCLRSARYIGEDRVDYFGRSNKALLFERNCFDDLWIWAAGGKLRESAIRRRGVEYQRFEQFAVRARPQTQER